MENKLITFLTNDEEGNIIPTSEGNFIRGYINGLNDAGKNIHYSEYQTLFEDESDEPVLAVDFYHGSKIENSDKQPIIFKINENGKTLVENATVAGTQSISNPAPRAGK